jgi:hypothetical protein
MGSSLPALARPAGVVVSPRRLHSLTSVPRILSVLSVIAAISVAGCDSASRVVGPAPLPETSLPANYSVQYDDVLGTPRTINNTEAIGAYNAGAPGPFSNAEAFQIVRSFVTRYATVFHFRPGTDDFVVTLAEGRDGTNLVKMQQTYLGLPVDVMGYSAVVLPNRSIGWMNGHFMSDIRVITLPLVSAKAAGDQSVAAVAAAAGVSPTVVHVLGTPTLLITTRDNVPRLTWSAITAPEGLWTPSWTVWVDAQRGTVLAVLPNFIIN